MKTSNKLLISLCLLVFLAILACSMVLKSEFEKIDRDDPYYGYSQEIVQPFKAVQLSGNYPGLVQLVQSDAFEIRMNNDSRAELDWQIKEDTLVINIQYPEESNNYQFQRNYAFYNNWAGFYIMTPSLSALQTEGISCKLTGWKEEQMKVKMKGSKGLPIGILFTDTDIHQLSADITQGGFILLDENNHIAQARIAIRDSSAFTVEYDVLDSLDLEVDNTAKVKLPGHLMRQFVP